MKIKEIKKIITLSQNNNIISLNNTWGKLEFKKNIYEKIYKNPPKAVIIDPLYILESFSYFLHKEYIKTNILSEISIEIKKIRKIIEKITEIKGIVVVFLIPYKIISHFKYKDIRIGIYDWIKEGAGRYNTFKVIENPYSPSEIELTELGENGPYYDYLLSLTQMNKYIDIEVILGKNIYPLAINGRKRAVSFILPYNNGKIVFVPKNLDLSSKEAFIKCTIEGTIPENWPEDYILKDINPSWMKNFYINEVRYIEEDLIKKEEELLKIELEYEKLQNKLSYFKKLSYSLFCSNHIHLGNSISSILLQWGVETYPKGEIIEIISGDKRGIVLPVVSDSCAKLWHGKKLMKYINMYNNRYYYRNKKLYKGILIINAYRNIHPNNRQTQFYSPQLLKFSLNNNIALISITDIYYAHQQKDKYFFEKIWDIRGSK